MVTKIAIIGTHCTRKSTLCHLLIGKLKEIKKSVGHLPEVATFCPLPINREGSLDAQLWILLTQIRSELELESRGFNYIVIDRSVLDNFVYLQRIYNKLGKKTKRHESIMKIASTAMNEWLHTYDYLFRVDIIDKEIIDDGIRDTDEEFRIEIEYMLTELCKKLKLDNLYDVSGSNHERLEKILSILKL